MPLKVVVIGGGASGLAAAITAAWGGAEVIILEHKDRVGKKILMTGNGKCNLTNVSDYHGKYYGEDVERIYSFLDRFSPQDTIAFFRQMGLYTKEKRDGGIYPVSEQATAVLDVLRSTCIHLGVKVFTECEPVSIKQGMVYYLEQKTQKKQIHFDKLILAAGGTAAPVSGSDGSGYNLAKTLGHHLIKPLPALVQLRCEGNYFKALSGVRAQAGLTLYIDHKIAATEEGELQLTDYGISGIPVFQISRYATRALKQKKQVYAQIDFMPDRSFGEVNDLLKLRFCMNAHGKDASQAMIGLCNKKLAEVLLKEAGIDLHIPSKKVPEKQLTRLTKLLKDLRVDITGSKDIAQAQVCAGGVDTREIDAASMMSKLIPGLFFAGEVVDIDGICGGYNLQWAWSSGYVAGSHAGEYAHPGKKAHRKKRGNYDSN